MCLLGNDLQKLLFDVLVRHLDFWRSRICGTMEVCKLGGLNFLALWALYPPPPPPLFLLTRLER